VSQRFTPGGIDYDGLMATHYPMGRALSSHSEETWRTTLEPLIRRAPGLTILDLGSGTGRFSRLLSDHFKSRVIGVEPARGMRTLAARDRASSNVALVAGTAERIPLRDQSCDAAWLSQVLHHFRNRAACGAELRRVVRTGGPILVRGTFAGSAEGFPTFLRFFPGARRIFEDIPAIEETIATFQAQDLALEAHRRVEQQICGSLREFAERTRLRADSALAVLSDSEFESCQTALERAAERESQPVPVFETLDLLVFRSGRA
jgi:SAM-dependent methyltransferase